MIERITTDIEERSEVFFRKGLKPEREKKERKEEEKTSSEFLFQFFGARQIRTNEHSTLFRGASPERKRTIFVSKNIFW